jgi:hypothetical protein
MRFTGDEKKRDIIQDVVKAKILTQKAKKTLHMEHIQALLDRI